MTTRDTGLGFRFARQTGLHRADAIVNTLTRHSWTALDYLVDLKLFTLVRNFLLGAILRHHQIQPRHRHPC